MPGRAKLCYTMAVHPIFEGVCSHAEEILKRAIDIGASDEELRKFKEFFNMHPNSDVKIYNQAREKGDGSFERLLAKALEDADQFKGKAKELLFDCFLEDLARGKHDHPIVYGIVAEKIKAHIEGKEAAQGQPEPPALTFEQIFKTDSFAAWAYQLAVYVGIIHGNGLWSGKWPGGAIVIYWEYLEGIDPVIVSQVDKKAAINAICERFGKSISERTGGRVPKYRDKLRPALKAATKNFPF